MYTQCRKGPGGNRARVWIGLTFFNRVALDNLEVGLVLQLKVKIRPVGFSFVN